MSSFARFRAVFGLVLAAAVVSSAAATSLTEVGRNFPGFAQAGGPRFAVADFDGDGKQDLVIPAANGGSALFEVLGETANGLAIKQTELLTDTQLARMLVSTASGAPHLVTISVEGIVRELGGWPLRELRNFSLGIEEFTSAAIGDIDADGHDELVVSANGWSPFVRVYDFETGMPRWAIDGIGAYDLLLEQLDADAALEIVLASLPGTILDGATQATDWTWKDGFGSYLAAGHFASSGGAQFVAARDWDLFTVFQSAPYSPVWDAETFNISAIAAADLDGDGFDEIVEGDGQWGSVNIYSSQTHAVILSVPNGGWGVSALGVVDFGGDGIKSIAYASIQASLSFDTLVGVFDAASGSPEWHLDASKPGPYAPVALGDMEGDGGLQFLFASEGNGYSQGVITQLDALTGTEEWQSPPENGNANDPYYLVPVALRTLPGSGNTAGSLIVAGTSTFSGRILKVDGATHEVLFQIGAYASGPMYDRALADIAIDDVDGDGVADIIACTYAGGTSGVRLQVFSSVDGAMLWESIAVGAASEDCNGVMVGAFDNAASPLMVAVLPTSLRAFDAMTHLVAWTLPVAADGATLLAQGAAGREFVVFSDSTLTFYDARTRVELRSFNLGTKIFAVQEAHGIDDLVVATDRGLLVVDGRSGGVRASTEFLGGHLGNRNQIAIADIGEGNYLVGAGSDVGAFRYVLTLSEDIFSNGFDP